MKLPLLVFIGMTFSVVASPITIQLIGGNVETGELVSWNGQQGKIQEANGIFFFDKGSLTEEALAKVRQSSLPINEVPTPTSTVTTHGKDSDLQAYGEQLLAQAKSDTHNLPLKTDWSAPTTLKERITAACSPRQTAESLTGRMGQSLGRGFNIFRSLTGKAVQSIGSSIGNQKIQDVGEKTALNALRYDLQNASPLEHASEIQDLGDIFEFVMNKILECAPWLIIIAFLTWLGARIVRKCHT